MIMTFVSGTPVGNHMPTKESPPSYVSLGVEGRNKNGGLWMSDDFGWYYIGRQVWVGDPLSDARAKGGE